MSGKIEANTPEERLAGLGLSLPPIPTAAGNYAGYVLAGSTLAISGQLSRRADGTLLTGRAGAEVDLAGAQEAARTSALNILAQAKAALGSLSRVERVLRLNGFVQSMPEFQHQAAVMNGASDLIVAVLGAAGVHTRAAVGATALPLNAVTEIDALILVKA